MARAPKDVKQCRLCLEVKPVSEFHVQVSKKGYRCIKYCCKACGAAETKRQYHTNPKIREKVKARSVQWQRDNPAKMQKIRRRVDLRNKYGLTEASFAAMQSAQGDACRLCGTPDRGRTGPKSRETAHWTVDHSHVTGRVRGLLCNQCNARLGSFEALLAEVGLEKLFWYLLEWPDDEQGRRHLLSGEPDPLPS